MKNFSSPSSSCYYPSCYFPSFSLHGIGQVFPNPGSRRKLKPRYTSDLLWLLHTCCDSRFWVVTKTFDDQCCKQSAIPTSNILLFPRSFSAFRFVPQNQFGITNRSFLSYGLSNFVCLHLGLCCFKFLCFQFRT